ncbi:hypothetical protein Ddc_21341 [Ditylenchus destructor]|nr:hypothetical protein Ddc_21341 [Ditylenchus destructor]
MNTAVGVQFGYFWMNIYSFNNALLTICFVTPYRRFTFSWLLGTVRRMRWAITGCRNRYRATVDSMEQQQHQLTDLNTINVLRATPLRLLLDRTPTGSE